MYPYRSPSRVHASTLPLRWAWVPHLETPRVVETVVIRCSNCGAPVSPPLAGGRVWCRYCRTSGLVPEPVKPRSPISLALAPFRIACG